LATIWINFEKKDIFVSNNSFEFGTGLKQQCPQV